VTNLTGTGTLTALMLSPGSIQFGVVDTPATSPDKLEMVSNNNPTVMGANTNVVVSGIVTSNSVFAIDPANTTCGTAPNYSISLAPGATCTVALNFTPSGTGSFTGTVNVSDNAGNGVQKGTLYGTGN
jgi:hypothetical protein